MLKAIIVDDEGKARRILERFIVEYCPQIEIVAMAEDVPQAVKAIQKTNPDVVFLDIEMPGYNGFQLLEFFDTIDFEIIFTTAYSEFALRAFQVSAIDYLLKPIQIDQLTQAVQKLEKMHGHSLIKERLATLEKNLEEYKIKKIVIPLSEGSLFVELKDILYLKAEGSYANILFKDGNKVIVSKNLKDYEDQLTMEEGFFRTHRSFLVNTDYIKQISSDGSEATMINDAVINISRERKQELAIYMKQKKLN
ncbi:MAG: LytTR family DNA-binding domain-containing protein [Bacteroidetes bacterium]|nr:LytTR family DNA-binding domain-containing protein [Bacteroidota bacterium]